MKRLSINEIKNDIKDGYTYMEYESVYYKGNLTIIHEPHNSKVIIDYRRNGYQTCYAIPVNEFMTMSRKDFDKRFANELYYNAVQYDI